MSLLTFGINHKSAPIMIRERLAFSNDAAAAIALKKLRQDLDLSEAVILSTCNRTEIYTIGHEPTLIQQWLSHHQQLDDIDISPYCYHHKGLTAVRHLMRVASGLDSMVVGESQILAQIKNAFKLALDVGTAGSHMQQLFPAIFSTSKHIRSTTNIGRCPVSVAYVIAKLCQERFQSLSTCNVLLVGSGTTIELVATHLNDCSINKMIIANRTLERAHELADEFDATAIRIGEIPNHLGDVDIVITATASQLPILGKGLFERIASGNRIVVIDLAVPRDVEPEVATLPNIELYNIDDLRAVINDNMQNRLSAAEQAESMIEMYAAHYMRQLRIHQAGDIIRHYRALMIQQRDRELDKAMAALKAGKNPQAVLKNYARNFVNKAMHNPTIKLRQAAADGNLKLLALAKELFK